MKKLIFILPILFVVLVLAGCQQSTSGLKQTNLQRAYLVKAIVDGNFNEVKKIVDNGEDINKVEDRVTPLKLALVKNQKDIAVYLISKGANVNKFDDSSMTPLRFSIIQGNSDMVKILLDSGANLNERDEQGLTPLMNAVMSKSKDVVELLIEKGVDVNAKDPEGLSALDIAQDEQLGDKDIADILIKAGAK